MLESTAISTGCPATAWACGSIMISMGRNAMNRMHDRGRAALFSSAAIFAVALASPAFAQDPAQQPAAPQNGSATNANSEQIVITATKRPQVLLDVPQSVTVVSGKTLEIQHANSFEDYLKLVPGLQLDQNTQGQGRLILRGINTGGVASTVSVYVDETPFGSSSGLVNGAILAGDFDTFDVNRIEVLRGPQGTLYGASSLSGVLRFVTNLPSTAGVEARARVGIESVKDGGLGYSGNAMVNVPLGDKLAFRASGTYRKEAGFIDSIGNSASDLFGNVFTADVAKNINDALSYGGRASLLFKPSDAVSFRLSAIAQNIKADAPDLIEADPVTLRPLRGLSQSQFVPQFTDTRYRVYNGTGVFNLGFAELTSSTSYSTQLQHLRSDLTFPLSGLLEVAFGLPPNEFFEPQDTNSKKFTQELRLSGQSHLVDWLVGAFYTNEKGLIQQDFVAVVPGTMTVIDPVPILGTILGTARVDSKYRELAGFANATIHFAPQFDLDIGGRYSHNKQSAHQVSDGALAGGFNDFPIARSSENVFTYSLAPKFKPNDHTTVYARVAKGFRPGGPNILPPGAPPSVPTLYNSDSVISWEAGVKAETRDHRFSIDASAFHIDWKKIQLFAVVNNFGVNVNGSSAKSDGVEFTATAQPIRGLSLSANGAYTNARLTGDTPDVVGGRKGDQLPFTPKFSLGLNGDYGWNLAGDARAHVGASLRHLSGQTANYDADFVAAFGRQRHIRPYNVVDLNAGVTFGRFDVEAYVKNLGNSHGITSTTATSAFGGLPIFPNGAIGTGIIRPRTIGLSLGVNFGK
jgi:iron complex outermembrane receptor protein